MVDFYYDRGYRELQSRLTKLSWQRGDYDFLRKRVERTCVRKGCENTFKTKPSDPKKYCSQNCAAITSNTGRIRPNAQIRKNQFCFNCKILLNRQRKIKYCSVDCQTQFYYKKWIDMWKRGEKDGVVGISTKNISGHLKRYLHEKFGNKCSKCAWNEKNPITGNVPLEIDHIDGNSENNEEKNLRLLCPNCHALTPFFKNLNKGKGRKWRMDKYVKNS